MGDPVPTPAARPPVGRDLAIAYVAIACVAAIDFISDIESHVPLSYIFAVAWASWRVSARAGTVVAIASAVVDTTLDLRLGRFEATLLPILWNVLVETGLLCTGGWVVQRLREKTRSETALRARLEEVYGRLAHAYRQLDREVEGVARIQRSLLPSVTPVVPGYQVAAHYASSARAGGDYYDILPLPGGRLGLLVADVSGHGPQAAVIMSMARVLVHGDREAQRVPERLLESLNAGLVENILLDHFVTACYVVIDPASGAVEYALAGHPRPIAVRSRNNRASEVGETSGPPLGLEGGVTYRRQTTSIEAGDSLVLYTDGLTEARSPDGELFDEAGIVRTLAESPEGLDAAAVVDRLTQAMARHLAGARNDDDVTIVVVRREPAPVAPIAG